MASASTTISVVKGKGPGLGKNLNLYHPNLRLQRHARQIILSELSSSEEIEEDIAKGSTSSESAAEGCLVDLNKTLEDKNGCTYHTKFTWPGRFTNHESRKQGDKVNPESVNSFGKRSSKSLIGQITDIRAPKQNNGDNKNWNFHFIIGKDGELVQAWVFGLRIKLSRPPRRFPWMSTTCSGGTTQWWKNMLQSFQPQAIEPFISKVIEYIRKSFTFPCLCR